MASIGRRFFSSASSKPGVRTRGLRLAVIGAGPAGFYTAYRVMSQLPDARVDMYESLPVPYGLVRYGVAPDHPEVKNCQDKFDEVAQSPAFTYVGNTPIGTSWPHPPHRSFPLAALVPYYDGLLLSYGASKDRLLNIPGEDTLRGVYSARDFVGWYNGLPECRWIKPLLDAEEAVVIGQGNVALDVARILLSDVDVLRKTDMAEYAIESLSKSKVKSVRIIGRRGPLQAAFTAKEIREQLSLPGVGFHPIPSFFYPDDISTLKRQQKRIVQILQNGSKTPLSEASRSWELRFLLSPTEFIPDDSLSRIGSIKLERNALNEPRFATESSVKGTGEYEEIPAQAVFRSIGYLSEPIPGLHELGIPFNARRGLVPNHNGRVVCMEPKNEDHAVIPGVYTSGWVKRGPTGVIASTMMDAFETADAIVEDWRSGQPFMLKGDNTDKLGWEGVQHEIKSRGIRSVNWEEWKKIDAVERERGMAHGKVREKFTETEEMLSIID